MRALFPIGDQALTSLSTFLLTVAIANDVTPTEFGKFAITQYIVILFVQLLRSTIGVTEITSRSDWTPSLNAALAVGPCLVVASLATYHWHQSTLLLVAAYAAFAAMLFEGVRIYAHARGDYRYVLPCDGFLLAATAASAWALQGELLPGNYLSAWLAISTTQVLCAAVLLGSLGNISLRQLIQYVTDNWQYLKHLTSAFGLSSMTWVASPLILSAVAGPASAGALRGSQTLTSLPQQIPQGLQPFVLRRWSQDLARVRRELKIWNAATLIFFSITLCLFYLPAPQLGRLALGPTWDLVRDIIPYGFAAAWIATVALALEQALRARSAYLTITRIRRVIAPLSVGAVAIGAVAGDLDGAYFGIIASQAALAGALFWAHQRAR